MSEQEQAYTVAEMRALADALELERRVRKLENQIHGVQVRQMEKAVSDFREREKQQNRELEHLRRRLSDVEDSVLPIRVKSCHRCGASGESQRASPGLCKTCHEWLEREFGENREAGR